MAAGQIASSPLSSAPSSLPTKNALSSQEPQKYYLACELPFELAQHIQVYLEESLFTQALNFLFSIASSKVSRHVQNPVIVPPPEYFGVISTIAVHPSITTRTSATDKREQANTALKILRFYNKIVGPVNARFTHAFFFRRYDPQPHRQNGWDDGESEDKPGRLSIPFADTDSLYTLAEDFWAVVGWTMNCACLTGMYSRRWEYWHPWLELMINVLYDDLDIHKKADTVHQSLLWTYIEASAGGNVRARRILRAVFADGSIQALKEFHEVFPKELKAPKSNTDTVKKREVDVNIEEEIWGDYLGENDSDDSSSDNEGGDRLHSNGHTSVNTRPTKRLRTRTPSARRLKRRSSDQSLRTPTEGENDLISIPALGPPECLGLRMRLLSLLIEISTSQATTGVSSKSNSIFPDLHDLFTLFVEFIRPLPLSVFQQLISPSVFEDTVFSSEAHITLYEFLLRRLIESAAPTVRLVPMRPLIDSTQDESSQLNAFDRVDGSQFSSRPTTFISSNEPEISTQQEILTTSYLPYAAATSTTTANQGTATRSTAIDSQARMSLVLEGLVRLYSRAGLLKKTPNLASAVESGIERRTTIATEGSDGRKKKGDNDEEAWAWLNESAQRIRAVVESLP